MWIISYGITVLIFSYLGFLLAKFLAKRSYSPLSEEVIVENVQSIFTSAQSQREIILTEAALATKEQYDEELQRLNGERNLIIRLNEKFESELNQRQSEVDKLENNLAQNEQKAKEKEESIKNISERMHNINSEKKELSQTLEQQLEQKAGLKKDKLILQMQDDLIASEKLGITKWLMDNLDALKSDAHTFAQNSLNSVYLRYQPQFIWPKSSFVVQLPSKDILQKYFSEDSPIIASLIENTDTNLSALTINEDLPPMLKIAGGAGVDKEIIRLTLEEMLSREVFQPEKIRAIFDKHKKQIEKYTLKLGEEALKILGLENNMDPVILKLIGSLNYRTSHRQNQYFHSIEVARLAGMIADEIGVDSMVTKRSGILHDIGKVLDYKIEGSHAVISADYATRYGENETIVDTVLAHHDDKIVETPFAYILKAADALSGARPGARVDMEEGYNRRIDGISGVVNSFQDCGVTGSAIMHAGREVHVYVDNSKVKNSEIPDLAKNIAEKLESEVEYPGQIRVTVIRRTEVTEVA